MWELRNLLRIEKAYERSIMNIFHRQKDWNSENKMFISEQGILIEVLKSTLVYLECMKVVTTRLLRIELLCFWSTIIRLTSSMPFTLETSLSSLKVSMECSLLFLHLNQDFRGIIFLEDLFESCLFQPHERICPFLQSWKPYPRWK